MLCQSSTSYGRFLHLQQRKTTELFLHPIKRWKKGEGGGFLLPLSPSPPPPQNNPPSNSRCTLPNFSKFKFTIYFMEFQLGYFFLFFFFFAVIVGIENKTSYSSRLILSRIFLVFGRIQYRNVQVLFKQ